MWFVFVTLFVCLLLGVLVVLYAAFVQRGLPVPYVPVVGEWMARAVQSLKRSLGLS